MSVEEEAEAAELSRAIDRFLETQTREDRILFVRRHFFGESVEDLAAAYGLSPRRVTVRLYRVRKRLKKHLEKAGVSL